jgi:hypothetical protein
VSTIAEIKAAIERLRPQEQEEIRKFLFELIAKDQGDTTEAANLPQAP